LSARSCGERKNLLSSGSENCGLDVLVSMPMVSILPLKKVIFCPFFSGRPWIAAYVSV
jgi:hypothetical protein